MVASGHQESEVEVENQSRTEIGNPLESPSAGAPPGVHSTVGTAKPPELTSAELGAGAAVDEHSTGPQAAEHAATSRAPAPAAESTDSDSSHGQSVAAKQVLKYQGIEEPVRTRADHITSWKPTFEVEQGFVGSLEKILERAQAVRAPAQATPVPTRTASYGSTAEIFLRLQEAIAGQASVPGHTSALLTYWTLSTWFADGLPLAPGLVIFGPEFESDLVLRTLRNYCRYPLMLTRADVSSLMRETWLTTRTALIFDPNITKQTACLLGSTAARGYLVNDGRGYRDIFGPKAICVGLAVSPDRIPRCSLQVRLQPNASPPATQHSLRETETAVQGLQNQLLRYRTKNLVRVYNSDFDAASLMASDMRAIGNALGACIVDSPELQAQLLSLLMPIESQRQADRSTGLEAVTLEAVLNLAHAGKEQILAGEIATEVNRLAMARGERQRTSAERVGHAMKKIGLATRRLGRAGRGLLMDPATMTRAHELAREHGGAGLEPDEINLHCPLC
jgi:hypothetical protein